jgi:hypothetical protein
MECMPMGDIRDAEDLHVQEKCKMGCSAIVCIAKKKMSWWTPGDELGTWTGFKKD